MAWAWDKWPPSRAEINVFLHDNNSYLTVLGEVRKALETYSQTTEGKNLIYRVASRADYQPEKSELKTDDSILGKLRKIEEREKRRIWPDELEDIIGIRVVCIYPRHVEQIADFVSKCRELRPSPAEKKAEDSGYRATHITVKLASPPDLRDIPCEIQIATMLEETWSFKTHDVVYKGKEVARQYEEHVKLLSDALAAIDSQSQLLEDQILERQKTDQALKLACMMRGAQRAADISFMDKHQFKKPKQYESLMKIWNMVSERTDALPGGDIRDILDSMDDYAQTFGTDLIICRIILHIALQRVAPDCNNLVIDYTNRFIRHSDDSPVAHRFKGVAYFYTGDSERALEQFGIALNKAIEKGDRKEEGHLRVSIAYTLAERGHFTDKKIANDHLSKAKEILGNDPNLVDTDGYLKIVFADTIEEAEAGYSLCQQALQNHPPAERKWWKPVFVYHRHVAFFYLLRLSRRQATEHR